MRLLVRPDICFNGIFDPRVYKVQSSVNINRRDAFYSSAPVYHSNHASVKFCGLSSLFHAMLRVPPVAFQTCPILDISNQF
jgi:hypothetical protein